jgi:hypothetical protein
VVVGHAPPQAQRLDARGPGALSASGAAVGEHGAAVLHGDHEHGFVELEGETKLSRRGAKAWPTSSLTTRRAVAALRRLRPDVEVEPTHRVLVLPIEQGCAAG